MKILCITDIHGDNKSLPLVLEKESDSDFIILGGDITHLQGYEQAAKILKPVLESHITTFAVHGNMDKKGVAEYLEEKNLNIHGRCVLEKGMVFLGLGGANPSPFHTPFEYSDEEARQILNDALAGITGSNTKIFISHAPPVNTALDVVKNGAHVGSGFVREIISRYHINLCVCGHIHEAAGVDYIGETICVNPGPLRDGFYAIADISNNRINIERRMI